MAGSPKKMLHKMYDIYRGTSLIHLVSFVGCGSGFWLCDRCSNWGGGVGGTFTPVFLFDVGHDLFNVASTALPCRLSTFGALHCKAHDGDEGGGGGGGR